MGKTKVKTPRAPRKLSKAILMALDDQLKAEKNPKIWINMDQWHSGMVEGWQHDSCNLCFAGAVMHYKHNLKLTDDKGFADFGTDWGYVFLALNKARQGLVEEALEYMKLPFQDKWNTLIVEYSNNRLKFRRQMRGLAKRLDKAGL